MGMFYGLEIYHYIKGHHIKKTTIYDSLKIIPFSVKDMSESFGLEISKLDLDYDKPREIGYELTDEEKDYIKNDVVIVAKSLSHLFKMGLTKMTIGSCALSNYKKSIHKNNFRDFFPKIKYELYLDLKRAYKGGFTYLNPLYKEKDVGEGEVIDVNSLYPYVMRYKPMPYGEPIFFKGKYEYDRNYPLYIQRLYCCFEIKKDKIPTIQIKKSNLFVENEYLLNSNNQIVELILTNIDLELFLSHYNVYDLKYDGGYKFKARYGIFDDYIDYWIEKKNEATINKNKPLRTISKLCLNSLYGKFATSMTMQSKIPYLDNGIVKYKLSEIEEKDGLYIPIGAFITAFAREKLQKTSQLIKEYSIKNYGKDLYIYSDTDSIHTLLPIEEIKKLCEVDDVKLGAWKHESHFTKARFVRQKTYLEMIDGKMKITCAGMPKECYKYVKWNKFKEGFSCGGKLTYKQVEGGVKLVETEFTIKSGTKLFDKTKSFYL